MRYRDCPTAEVSLLVEGVTPAEVWELISDIALPTRHATGELQQVQWCEGFSAPGVGARFEGTNENDALGRWTTVSEIVEYDVENRWVWRVLDPRGDTMATWGFEVEPTSRGALVRQWARMGPAPSGLTIAIEANPHLEARIVARRLEDYRAAMAANLEWVRERLGADPG